MHKFIRITFFSFLFALCISCGTKRLPNNVVKLNENQLELMNGFYEIEAYQSAYNPHPTPLTKLLQIAPPALVTYLELEFINSKQLKVSYELDGHKEEKVLKGRAKHGGFYLHKRWGAIGIPYLLYTRRNEGKRLFMGNDDNLIYDEFEDATLSLFGITGNKALREIYYFDRLYPAIYTGNPQPDMTD